MTIVVMTNQTSPYQVEFMDAIAADGAFDLRVVYLHSQCPGRNWSQPAINHQHVIAEGDRNAVAAALAWVCEADLVVFGYYRDRFASKLMRERAELGKPWCFWGERMGVTRWSWAGWIYRRWKLRWIHRSRAGIWAIGEFGLQRYLREFGRNRVYCNVPYYSDLSRFQAAGPRLYSGDERRILYSGSLEERKGADVLAVAFRQVAERCPNLWLTFLGEGSLRAGLAQELTACADRVSFEGFVDWPELPQFYHQADLLCAPSRHDGWGLVVPEGLAAGLPVISTKRAGAALELIEPGLNGWLLDAGNVEQLAAVLETCSKLSLEELTALSQAAQKAVMWHSVGDGVRRFKEAVAATLEGWT